MDIESINQAPKYKLGDILQVCTTGALFLVEDIEGWEYFFRILDNDSTRRDSIFYIDQNTNIVKVA